jgi:serine/threonine protein kinase
MLLFAAGITAVILAMIFIVTPVLKVIGMLVAGLFRLIGWLVVHIFEFVSGMLGDVVRLVGAIIAMVILTPLAPLNVIVGRWSAAGHFADSVRRECKVAGLCIYRIVLQRPLRFLLLQGLLEGVEQRVPEAMAAAPTSDKPRRRRIGSFPGYTIRGSLPGGGSGAKLYVAEPEAALRDKGMPDRVVIKAFALSEGSSLPQIVRESRALEAAKQLGLVLDHDMDESRFFYVMPYHAGDHLGIITRQLHGECGAGGLSTRRLRDVMGYMGDLLATLSVYHRGGLWHKDVKPENIIVHGGRAHLVDLGLVTPLRSAMTLTTHGTEYFRDPEMVRQALRGVKVHQVDGAKFDVYAVGAVLYFMVENTFPAHGGLSRFKTKSPDALRWIIRRAMADYGKRYATADAMLADLSVVTNAGDPFAVKPADLPSMGGAAVDSSLEPELDSAAEEQVAAAAMDDATFAAGPAASVVPPAGHPRRPRLRVTNWWTGEYVVDDPGDTGPGGSRREEAPAAGFRGGLRDDARALRHHAQQLRSQVKRGTKSAQRAAREQVKLARRRALDIQRRAAKRTPARAPIRARGEKPSILLGVLGLFFVGAVLIGAAALAMLLRSPGFNQSITWSSGITSPAPDARPVAVVLDSRKPNGALVRATVANIAEEYRDDGYRVIDDHEAISDRLGDVLASWIEDQDEESDEALEDLLEEYDLYGVVYVHETSRRGAAHRRLDHRLIYSTRPGAEARRFGVPAPVPPVVETAVAVAGSLPNGQATPPTERGLELLLVNDHPAKLDPAVERHVAEIVRRYTKAGWTVKIEDDAEVAVRSVLPLGALGSVDSVSPKLAQTLEDQRLAGILLVTSKPGSAPLAERIATVELIASEN